MIRAYVTANRGRLLPTDHEEIDGLVRHAKFGDGEMLDLTIEKHQEKRSEKANNYLWGVVYKLIAEDTGHKPEELHDAMCEMFLPNERKRVEFFNKMTGEALQVDVDARRTSKLTGGPFYDFVEEVRQWALDFRQIVTPDPDPEYWRKRGKREKAA